MTHTSRIMSKPEFQVMRRALVAQGLPVKKIDGGYVLRLKDKTEILRAMNGHHGYLVRYVSDLFA